jgi:hypothetical protein
MALLLAEELLLVVYRPDGTARGQATELDCGLGGALLLDLVLGGHAEVVDGRLRATNQPGHPVLRDAYDQVAAKARKPQAWVTRFAKGTRRGLLADLVEAGVLADEPYRWLGMFTRHRFPVVAPGPRDDALRRLHQAITSEVRPGDARSGDERTDERSGDERTDERTAALASIIGAAKLEKAVFPDADRRAVKRRLKAISEEQWAADAVRKAIDAVHAATVAAITAASAAASAGGSS